MAFVLDTVRANRKAIKSPTTILLVIFQASLNGDLHSNPRCHQKPFAGTVWHLLRLAYLKYQLEKRLTEPMTSNELNPIVTTTVTFSIECPICRKHRVEVPIGPGKWSWDGQTLAPSVLFEGGYRDITIPEEHQTILCKGHFTITNGQINIC